MVPSPGLFPYAAIHDRPKFEWPDGKRLAVYVALNCEHFAYNSGPLGLSYSPGNNQPNTYNWAWREYGPRVGAWRLIDLFDEYRLPFTVLLNTECYDYCPSLVAAFRARGDEIAGHGRTNSERPNGMAIEQERASITDVAEAIRRNEGVAPGGWMSPIADPSINTEALLAEAGYRYTLDWPLDDQPVWMQTKGGPLLSVPYPHEVNDVPMIVMHNGASSDFADMVIDNFDEMLQQSKKQPLAYGISIHTFIVGQPFRIKQFRRVLDHMTRFRDDVWFTTAGAIAKHYAAAVPPPGSKT